MFLKHVKVIIVFVFVQAEEGEMITTMADGTEIVGTEETAEMVDTTLGIGMEEITVTKVLEMTETVETETETGMNGCIYYHLR